MQDEEVEDEMKEKEGGKREVEKRKLMETRAWRKIRN